MTREHYQELLRQLDAQVIVMGEMVERSIADCMEALEQADAGRAQELVDADAQIDQQRYAIENQALVVIATQQPMAGDLRTLASILTIVTELERIGDYCEGIAKLTLRMVAEPVQGPMLDLQAMATITRQLLRQAMQAFAARDVEAAGDVWRQDDDIDALYEQVFRRTLLNMVTDKTSVRTGTYTLWVAHNFERMADRITNIAERVAFVVTGDVALFRERMLAQTVPSH